MAPEAFVCPHCRTWVEGEGRTIRCPSCGKRFRADEARLDPPRTPAGFETLDYEVPDQGWDYGEPVQGTTVTEALEKDPAGWRVPESTTYGPTQAPDYEAPPFEGPEPAAERRSEPWPSQPSPAEPSPEESTSGESAGRSTPWGWIVGIAVLVLFFVGGRFLSGELFIVAFLALIAAQWFLDRNKDRDAS